MTNQAKIINGTSYPLTCPDAVVRILEHYRQEGRKVRLKIHYGNPATKENWNFYEVGYIGRSTGSDKIPLIVHNKRSLGGGAIMCSSIVKIEFANQDRGGILYEVSNES